MCIFVLKIVFVNDLPFFKFQFACKHKHIQIDQINRHFVCVIIYCQVIAWYVLFQFGLFPVLCP